ncbi:hypothetical protein I2F27_06305 [Acinetobacter sp. B5B]|uniref:hypothetical protein n=1 Tax=Acinetobacter baretiae TaxID=2605383 RepID=UPI0018C33844|nr:hypothetical protein [Acinetobacter baretiae]MBF7682940.1 hypothetical protein [Acinetobacter baretiae]MBF7684907.1 hypothetical protein [Acinetobacter baretiae]
MTQNQRQINKKRWIIFGVALLLPILLVLLLFVAASQDAKMKKQYEAERASYAENYQKTQSEQLIASDPEARTSSNVKP